MYAIGDKDDIDGLMDQAQACLFANIICTRDLLILVAII
jgi:hypothetical protein